VAFGHATGSSKQRGSGPLQQVLYQQ